MRGTDLLLAIVNDDDGIVHQAGTRSPAVVQEHAIGTESSRECNGVTIAISMENAEFRFVRNPGIGESRRAGDLA